MTTKRQIKAQRRQDDDESGQYVPPPVNPKKSEPVRQRLIDAAQTVLGLPILFRKGDVQWADDYRIELVLPSGYRIDLGSLMFDEDGRMQPHIRCTTPALAAVLMKMNVNDFHNGEKPKW